MPKKGTATDREYGRQKRKKKVYGKKDKKPTGTSTKAYQNATMKKARKRG